MVPGCTDHLCVTFRTVVEDILLPMAAEIVDIKRVEVDLRFRLVITAKYRFSAGVVIIGRPDRSF